MRTTLPRLLSALLLTIGLSGAPAAGLSAAEWQQLAGSAVPDHTTLAAGRPRLVLHLLGDFTAPDCCANSRMFKVLVHPDPRVAPRLDELRPLWFSERAVPKVTIDLGGGRVLRTTFTGNSVHYLVDGHGDVVDVLPGLVGPGAFRQWLDEATALAALPPDRRAARRQELIAAARVEYVAASRRALLPLAGEPPAALARPGSSFPDLLSGFMPVGGEARPGAAGAADRAMSKALVERPVFAALGRDLAPIERWRLLGQQLDPALVQLAPSAAAEVVRQAGSEEALPPLLERLAADTARARWELRPQALALLDAPRQPELTSVDIGQLSRLMELNHAVYARVLASPLDDPWNGFDPHQRWDGIDRSPTGWNPLP